MKDIIRTLIGENLRTTEALKSQINIISKIARKIMSAARDDKKIIVFGNGGSAADAQHFAAELVVKFEKKRPPLNALALTTNTSTLTACGNDFGFDEIFVRQLEPLLKVGDIAIGISTSGNSPNVVKAIAFAKKKKIFTIGLTGRDGGLMKEIADLVLFAPSDVTARIQESHILAIHIICKLIEEVIFSRH